MSEDGSDEGLGLVTTAKKAKSRAAAKRKPVDPKILIQRSFTRRIRNLFTNMGFIYIPSDGLHFKIGNKTGELDSVFMYENVLLVVEETTSTSAWSHAKNKKILAEEILGSKGDLIQILRENFKDHDVMLSKYKPSRLRVFYLYISLTDMDLDDDDVALLKPMLLVDSKALNYFDKLAKTIKRSARTDLWRFLELSSGDIGAATNASAGRTIDTAIISPDDNTGFNSGVRLVSFMIAADVLLRNGYVLRKDNWGYSTDLYQRLIDPNRIKTIRRFVASDDTAFLNNIIIGLPEEVAFKDASGSHIGLDDIQDYSGYQMTLPDEFNSLCIIDGQHRVFAHYEGVDELEAKVASIRSKVHLLATGLIFPKTMGPLERLQQQGEIFLAINSNSKPVPADVLLAIQALRDPYADIAIARRVLESLNRRTVFKNMFQLSQMDNAPIKIASIIKYALRYLVDIDANDGLFMQWVAGEPDRLKLRSKDDETLLASYVSYATSSLDGYFGALRAAHKDEWTDPEFKITSTTALNGMIIAFRRSLPAMGVLSNPEYAALMGKWKIDFAKTEFRFASSQYNLFSLTVLQDLFGLVQKEGQWVVES